ncbi:hypothetical protein [Streptomyces sp. NPDC017448]|uniref:hypothetical protein n=1 Tax=Streptomyces sp. NPDC017448 TaxID=3364996 RepID=UPI003788ED1D
MTMPTPSSEITPPAPDNGPQGQPSAPRTYTEDDLARARQQEKDKLYRELEKLRETTSTLPTITAELETLRKEREDREAATLAAQQQAEEEAKAKREAEMSAKELLDQRNAEWAERIAQLEKEREVERELVAKEKEFAALRDYTQRRITEESSNIAPELIDLVDGNTAQEIDASIERLKAKSAAIAEKVRGTQQQLGAQQRGVSPAGFNSAGPMDMLPTTQNYSRDDIANMSLKEYAEKVRGQFIGGDARNRGLFG